MVPALRRLANKSIDIAEFYYAIAIKLLGKAGLVENRNHLSYFSGTDGSGVWQEKLSGNLKAIFRVFHAAVASSLSHMNVRIS